MIRGSNTTRAYAHLLTTAREESTWKQLAVVLAVAALYFLVSWTPHHHWDEFFYLFSVSVHTPRQLVQFEAHQSIFTNGYFSGKVGHVVLLRLLLVWFGTGWLSLVTIQSIYAVIMLGFVGAAWGTLRELLDQRSAGQSALVLLFLPVTTYLGFKTLSEVPSLLFTTLGCWAFLRSFRGGAGRSQNLLLAMSAVSVALGALSRVTGLLGFIGLVLALWIVGDPRFQRGQIIRRAAPLIAAALILYTLGLYWVGAPLSHLVTLAHYVAGQSVAMERLYALALAVQGFALVVPLGLSWRGPPARRIAAVWLGITGLPCLLLHEPRYYAPALVPLAVVAASGISNLTERLFRSERHWVWLSVLAALVLLNRLVFAPLMPYEVDQRALAAVVTRLEKVAPGGTYLVPWFSDFAFLRVAFPGDQVRLCITPIPGSRYTGNGHSGIMPAEDRWWAGAGNYVGSRAALDPAPHPWYYIGWTYSPSLLRLRQAFATLGIYWARDPQRAGWHDHLTGSWIWRNSGLSLTPMAQEGQYRVFRIKAPE
jgi:hypothetical protein